jgi:hypothetical protein
MALRKISAAVPPKKRRWEESDKGDRLSLYLLVTCRGLRPILFSELWLREPQALLKQRFPKCAWWIPASSCQGIRGYASVSAPVEVTCLCNQRGTVVFRTRPHGAPTYSATLQTSVRVLATRAYCGYGFKRHSFLTSALIGLSGQVYALATLAPMHMQLGGRLNCPGY